MKVAKLVLWISALVLIAALGFSVIYVSVKQKDNASVMVSSKQVKNTQRFSDGLPREGLFKYETKISKEGKYSVTFTPEFSSNTFVIGSEVYDSDGKLLGAVVLYDGEEKKDRYAFTEGTCSFVFRYLTTEQDFRDFVDEYEADYNASSISKALQKVDFEGFDENGKVTVNCKVGIGSSSASGVRLFDVGVFTILSVSLLAVLIVLGVLYRENKPVQPEVYDGTAPAVPEPPVKQPKVQPGMQQVPYGYAQPVYQQPVPETWICTACGEKGNKGRFCLNCGQPRTFAAQQPLMYVAPTYQIPTYQLSTYQVPTYQAPSYTVPVQQQYYQMPVQTLQPVQPMQQMQALQPVQYAQPVFAPVPVQPAYVPAQPVIPDYRVPPKKQKKAHPPADPEFVNGMKERIPAIGARYAAFCVVFLFVQLAGALLLTLLVPDVVRQYRTSLSYGLIVLAVDAIGFPFIWLLMQGVPKTKIEQHKLSFSQWFGYLMMTEGLIIIGSLVGSTIHSFLTQPFNGDANTTASMMADSNIIIRTLVVGVGAPVFEELIFRKVLVDRTIKYGEYVSIVMSGIMFGLLHGNFQQFFFAALVGMLFAYVYIRTGRVRYTIFLHMAINLSSSLVVQTLLQKMLADRNVGKGYSGIAMLYAMLLLAWIGGVFAIGIIGIVKLIKGLKRKRLALNIKKGEPSHKEVRKLLLGDNALWLYIAMCLLFFLHSYLPNIIVFIMDKVK